MKVFYLHQMYLKRVMLILIKKMILYGSLMVRTGFPAVLFRAHRVLKVRKDLKVKKEHREQPVHREIKVT
jgi:hypothetical protein